MLWTRQLVRGAPSRPVLAIAATVALTAAAVFVAAPSASAATFTPSPDPTVDGGAGSLRAAIVAATTAGGDTIDLAAGGTYTLTCAGGGALSHGATPLTINGNGATIVQTCANSRVLGTLGSLTLDAVTLTGGNGTTGPGAGLFANTGAAATLTITNSTITGNSSSTTNGSGGGIFTSAITSISNSTISDNHENGSGTSPTGGGIYAAGTSISLDGTTVTGNTAVNGAGMRLGAGDFTMTSSTVSD